MSIDLCTWRSVAAESSWGSKSSSGVGSCASDGVYCCDVAAEVMKGAAEILVYGTAAVIEDNRAE